MFFQVSEERFCQAFYEVVSWRIDGVIRTYIEYFGLNIHGIIRIIDSVELSENKGNNSNLV